MKIVCLIKQIPRPDAIEFDQETKQLKREGVPLELNAFDAFAVTEAARLRNENGGEVIAMTMGPPQAEEALHECIRLGADRGIHLSDRAFAVADTLGTSRTLAMAIEKEGCDLVLCGRKTLDSETWQVPPEVAAFLGRPHTTNAVGLALDDGRLQVRRETDEGEETIELPLPGLVSIARTADESSGAERDGRIDVWTASDLVDDLRENDKRFGQTGSPTRVLAVRDVTPERLHELAPSPEQGAERVATLLGERPRTASAWEKPERLGEKPGRAYDCWSFVETLAGRPSRTSLELVAKGRELAGKLGGASVALVLGHDVGQAAAEVARRGGDRVVVAENEALREPVGDVWAAALRQVVERERPHVLLIPASARGRDLGPRVAGELELGMTGDCVDLGIDRAGRLIQHKPAYGGNIVSVIMGATTPQLATVRPRMFEPLEPTGSEGELRQFQLDGLPPATTSVLDNRPSDTAPYTLDEAEVIVCAGEGVGADGLAELERAAAVLGAAIGGDRAACAAGVVPWSRQIGLLGRQVAPRLYIAVETSADFEHAAASVKADVILVLRSSDAPVRGTADVAVAGDWRETLPCVVQTLSGRV
ncbi:MAG TPA: FAD-binding protein [Gaiellaceae bacterium]